MRTVYLNFNTFSTLAGRQDKLKNISKFCSTFCSLNSIMQVQMLYVRYGSSQSRYKYKYACSIDIYHLPKKIRINRASFSKPFKTCTLLTVLCKIVCVAKNIIF